MNVMNSDRQLGIPQGTESSRNAWHHYRLVRMTEDLFSSWGYQPFLTPVFDYYEHYRHLMDPIQHKRSYRFPDRDGELLILRSDVTLFLARQLSFRGADSPRRVFYADSILRHQEKEDLSSDEFFQAGAELIGLAGQNGDLEILMLLYETLSAMNLPEWRLHIGSRKILNALAGDLPDFSELGGLLAMRDAEGLCRLLESAGLDRCDQRVDLMLFLGTPEEFSRSAPQLVKAAGNSSELLHAAEELESLTRELLQMLPPDLIRIDLSEHGPQPYYTGFTVQAYTEGASTAVASGGRYDELLGLFGHPAPAAGFSLMMRKLEPLCRFASKAPRETFEAAGRRFTDRYSDSLKRRQNGETVIINPGGGTQ